jgi:hypothetical protein
MCIFRYRDAQGAKSIFDVQIGRFGRLRRVTKPQFYGRCYGLHGQSLLSWDEE